MLPEQAKSEAAKAEASVSRFRIYQRWLGHWKPEYDAITDLTELMLQV